MMLADHQNRRRPSGGARAKTAAVTLGPLLVLTYACLESVIMVAAGQMASIASGLR